MNKFPLKAVIFDLGNVLIGVDFDKAIAQAAKYTSMPALAIRQAVSDSSLLHSYESGRIDTDTFCTDTIKLLQLDITREDFVSLWFSCFERWPEMEKLFQELCQQMPVAILSNTSPLHWEYIAQTVPEFTLAKEITLSYELGICKPVPDIYLATARGLGINNQDCIFIDDLEVNVKGALDVGMQAFQFTSAPDTRNRIFSLL
ncbi:MAG: HAD family phosphatase [Planctomycetes bacterium]|nr:HAD family phosphatase [Planctomycetota bacterium]